jgi:hypothetical protein
MRGIDDQPTSEQQPTLREAVVAKIEAAASIAYELAPAATPPRMDDINAEDYL